MEMYLWHICILCFILSTFYPSESQKQEQHVIDKALLTFWPMQYIHLQKLHLF